MNTVDKITPWEVSGQINFDKLIDDFGLTRIDDSIINRWELVTGKKAHPWIKRGIIFCHQDLDKIIDCVEAGIPIYVYTGRGASSQSLHLGHLIPFKFAQYLQETLNCIVIIQMSDDEKFLFSNGKDEIHLTNYHNMVYENAKDIIACGFDIDKTYIFSNLEKNTGDLYLNNIIISKAINMNQIKNIYGLGESYDSHIINTIQNTLESELLRERPDVDKIKSFRKFLKSKNKSSSIGQCMWPVFQTGPAFVTSFREIFIKALEFQLQQHLTNKIDEKHLNAVKNAINELNTIGSTQSIRCLVPMAIDQAPYFRMARDVAKILKHPKPSVICSKFLPSLDSKSKMSSSGNNAIFLNMTEKKVKNMINRHALSGGRDTLEEHKLYGGDIKVDICYQYLVYFMDDENQLKMIAEKFTNGEMSCSELKNITSQVINSVIKSHQEKRSLITDTMARKYFNADKVLNISGF